MSHVQLAVIVIMVLQSNVQLEHIVQQVVLLSQKTVQLEVTALAVITLKNAIVGVSPLKTLSIALHVIPATSAMRLDSPNRFSFLYTQDQIEVPLGGS